MNNQYTLEQISVAPRRSFCLLSTIPSRARCTRLACYLAPSGKTSTQQVLQKSSPRYSSAIEVTLATNLHVAAAAMENIFPRTKGADFANSATMKASNREINFLEIVRMSTVVPSTKHLLHLPYASFANRGVQGRFRSSVNTVRGIGQKIPFGELWTFTLLPGLAA